MNATALSEIVRQWARRAGIEMVSYGGTTAHQMRADVYRVIGRRDGRTASVDISERELLTYGRMGAGDLVGYVLDKLRIIERELAPPPMFRIGTRPHPKRWMQRRSA